MIDLINGSADGWWLWVTAISLQTALLGGFVWLIDLPLRKRGWVQVRYVLWLVVFVKLVLPPGLSSPTSVPSRIRATATSRSAVEVAAAPVAATVPIKPKPAAPAMEPPATAAAPMAATPPVGIPMQEATARVSLSWRSYLLVSWAMVSAALLAVLAGKAVSLARAARRGARAPEAVQRALSEWARRLHLPREPRLLLTDAVRGPAVFGVWRPVVLLPEAVADLADEAQLGHMLLHEVAHIKRRDLAVNAAQTLLHIMFWFHPVVWLAGRRLRETRELCCDATVAAALGDQTPRYRETLIAVARRMMQPSASFTLGLMGLFESKSRLEARLSHLAAPAWKTRKRRTTAAVAVMLGMLLLVVPMGACGPEAKPGPAPQGTPAPIDRVAGERPFRTVLESGTVVELLGVRYHPSGEGAWWRPDGSPLASAPYGAPYDKHKYRAYPGEGEEAREFACSVLDPDGGDFSTTWEIDLPTRSAVGFSSHLEGEQTKSMNGFAVAFQKGHKTATVRIGVEHEEWEALFIDHLDHSGGDGLSSVRGDTSFLLSALETPEGVVITGTCELNEKVGRRIVVIDLQGELHMSAQSSVSGAGEGKRMTATFIGLELSDLKETRFQIRPYEWVEFANVALEPTADPAFANKLEDPSAESRSQVIPIGGGPALTGRITDQQGNPVPEVKVTLFSPRTGTYWAKDRTVTDSNGEYLFTPIESIWGTMRGEGGYAYRPGLGIEHPQLVSADGNSGWDVTIPDRLGEVVRKDFTMVPGGTAAGVVIHPDTREPVAGVHLRMRTWGTGRFFIRYPTTDAQGKFHASPLFPGTYTIDANHGSLRYPVLGEVSVVADETSNVELEFDKKRPPRWAQRLAVGPPGRAQGARGWTAQEKRTGEEWLELDFAPALRANEVRIHETKGPGAVTEVVLKDGEGHVISSLAVDDKTNEVPGFLEVSFPLTPEPVASVRVILDNTKVKERTWIDAVELVGPGGRGWAVDARASSALADLRVWLAKERP